MCVGVGVCECGCVGLWVLKQCLLTKLSVPYLVRDLPCVCVGVSVSAGVWVCGCGSIVCLLNCLSHTWYEACHVNVWV